MARFRVKTVPELAYAPEERLKFADRGFPTTEAFTRGFQAQICIGIP